MCMSMCPAFNKQVLSVGLHSPTGVQMKASPAGSRRKNGMRDAAAGSAFQAGRALERPSPAGVATAPQHHSTTLMLCQQGLWCCGLVAILEEDRVLQSTKKNIRDLVELALVERWERVLEKPFCRDSLFNVNASTISLCGTVGDSRFDKGWLSLRKPFLLHHGDN